MGEAHRSLTVVNAEFSRVEFTSEEDSLQIIRRIFPATYIVVGACLLAFIGLAVLQFAQINSELQREKIAILVDRVAAPFEAAATIGLPISSVRNADALVERARQLDNSIEGVFLLDANGTLVASASSADLLAVPAEAYSDGVSQTTRHWSGETGIGYYSGLRLFDGGGSAVGAVVVTYSGRDGAAQIWAMIGKLLTTGLLFAVGIAPLLWFALRRTLWRIIETYEAIDNEIQEVERENWLVPASRGYADLRSVEANMLSAAVARYRNAVETGKASAGSLGVLREFSGYLSALRGRLILVLLAFIATAFIAFSALVLVSFDRAIEPELKSRASLVGNLVQSEVQRALELGIPMSALGGLSSYAQDLLQSFPDISRVTILTKDGEPIAEAARSAVSGGALNTKIGLVIGVGAGISEVPVFVGSEFLGTIRIEGSEVFVQTRLRDVILDVLILTLAILLIGVEIAIAVVSATVFKPHAQLLRLLEKQARGIFVHVMPVRGPAFIRRLAAQLNNHAIDLARRGISPPKHMSLAASESADIRLPLFFFALGSEITASFLPIMAGAAERPVWLSANVAAAAPLFVYLVCLMALFPFIGPLSRRYGPRRLFLVAVPIAFVGLAWMAGAKDATQIALARGVVALAYALATVAAQDYALRAEPGASPITMSSVFLALIFSGTFCGSIIGGVVASRFGYPVSILLGALFLVVAGAIGRTWSSEPGIDLESLPDEGARVASATADKARLAALFVGFAMPLSAVTAAFVWYYVPVTLDALGLRTADIARVVMLYYLAAILLGPLVGLFGREVRRLVPIAISGAGLAGSALLFFKVQDSFVSTTFAVLVVGVAHSLLRLPILALTLSYSGSSTRPISALRILERLGALAGLVVAMALGRAGMTASLAPVLGGIVLAGAILFILTGAMLTRAGRMRHPC